MDKTERYRQLFDLAQFFLDSKINPAQPGKGAGQLDALEGNMDRVFEAFKDIPEAHAILEAIKKARWGDEA